METGMRNKREHFSHKLGTFMGGKSSRANVAGKENTHRLIVGDYDDLRKRRERHCVWQRLSQQVIHEIVREDTFKKWKADTWEAWTMRKWFSKPEGRKDLTKEKMARRVENGGLTSRATRLPSLTTGFIFLVITSWKNKTRNVQTSAWSSHRQIEKERYLRRIFVPYWKSSQDSSACWPLSEDSFVFAHQLLRHLQSSNRHPATTTQQQPYGRRVYPCRFHFW